MPDDSENHGLDRVRHELRSEGLKHDLPSPLRFGVHSRGYLPHVKRDGAEYFVTFRLADSLPKEVLLRYEEERTERLRMLEAAKTNGNACNDTEERINRDFRRKVERYLDKGAGTCYLRKPEAADLVASALKHFDNQRYLLRRWVIMPNHVHTLFWPMPNFTVSDILKSWKQFTSLRIKRLLGLPEGKFWQPEPFDHWIRNDEERSSIGGYIERNPVIAGLCTQPEDWRWSSAYGEK